jgi:hypothetical protein
MMTGATAAQCDQALSVIQSAGYCGDGGSSRDASGDSSSTGCGTKGQSAMYSAQGSCSGSMQGVITISTQPGLCSLVVKGGQALGLPSQGKFTSAARQTGYDITKGNWDLSTDESNADAGSLNVVCTAAAATSSTINLNCASTVCGPGGGPCSNSMCVEQLKPTP